MVDSSERAPASGRSPAWRARGWLPGPAGGLAAAARSARGALAATVRPARARLALLALVLGALATLVAAASPGATHVAQSLVGARPVAALLSPAGTGWPLLFGLLGATAGGTADDDVQRLVDGVRDLADGDTDVAFELDRDDDVGRLADALDDLAASIEAREAEHREREAFRDDLLDAIDDVFYVLDREGTHRRWNQTLCDVTGYDDAELATMHPLDLFEGEDRERARASMEEAFETGRGRVEAEVVTKDGERVPHEFVASRVEAPDGRPVLAGVARDVTERREYERRLAAVGESVSRLAAAETEAEIAETVCSIVGEVLEEPLCALWVHEADAERLVPAATSEAAAEIAADLDADEPLVIDASCAEFELFRDGESRVVEDYAAVEDAAYPDAPLGTLVTVPIGDRGLLAVGYPAVRDVDSSVVELLEILAGHVEASMERVEREERLARYKEFTDQVVDALDDVFYVVDRDRRMQRWNHTVREVKGYDDEEIASTDVLEFFVEADRDRVERAIEGCFEAGSGRVEARIRTKDGEVIPYEFSASALRDPDGREVLVGVGRDVSERKERQRMLEALVQNTSDPIYIKDREGRYQFVNRATADRLGTEPEAVVGLTDEDLFDPETAADIRSDDERVIETGELVEQEVERPTAGESRYFLDQKYPYRDEDGEVVGVMGISRDVTERRRREQELSRLVSNIPGLVYRTLNEPEWPTEFVSEGVREITGYEPEQFESGEVTWGQDVIAARNQYIWEETQAAVEDREPFTFTYPIRTADGERRWVKEQGRGVYDEDGELEFLEGVIIEVTERVEYERELEARNAAMEETIDGISILDDDETYVYANQAHADVYGYDDPEAFLGETWQLCYPEHEEDRIESEVLWALAEEGSWRGEAVGERADGSTFPQELSLTMLDDGRYVCVVRDVSDRKRRERELERNRALLQQAQRAAGIGGWELDLRADPPEMTWTDQLYELHGVDPGTEIDVERALEFYHPDDRERIRDILQTAIEEGEPYDMEARLRTGDDGEQRWIRAIAEPVEEDGEVVALRGSIQDVTDHKRRERELERTKDLLQQAERMGGLGGWELRVDEEPYEGTWTRGLFDIFGMEPREPLPLTDVFEHIHPEDQRWVRSEVRRGLESGQPFSLEHRIVAGDGDVRWVRVVAEPVAGEPLYRGAILDVTGQKERELILQSLHDAARGLLQTGTPTEVADLAVDTAEDVLDVPCAAVYLLDDETGYLTPVAYNEGFEENCGDPAPSSSGADETLLWEAYVSESATTLSESDVEDSGIFEVSVTECVYVPVGDHGVLVVASPERTIDPGTRRVAETLAATMEAALGRLDSETDLLEREAELEAQNRQLRRQIQVNEIIRSVDQSLIGASSRDEIETAVCERLTEGEEIAFAWIGALDAGEEAVVPRAWAGAGGDYLDAVSLSVDADPADPAVRTARTGESTVVESVVEGVKEEAWRKHALVSKFSSAVAVPIAVEEYTYGVLAVYGTEPGQFGDLERAVFEELGESIANSINAVETRQAIYADTFVELTLRVEGAEDFLARVARRTGGTVEYVGLGTHSESESRVFFEVAGVDRETVSETLADAVAVREHRAIAETGAGGDDGDEEDADVRHLFEATVDGEVLAATLVRRGGVPRSMTATGDRLEVVVDVPATIDVREFVETLREDHDAVELVARRDVQRDVETRQELVGSLFEELTDRQLEVLRTAYFAGFFGWPRESTGEEIAELLGVSQPTVNRHVRHALQRLLEQLFEEEPAALVEAQ